MGNLQSLANVLGAVASIGVLIACVMLWLHQRSPWLLMALIGEIASMLCRLVVVIAPSVYTEFELIRIVWPLFACVFAAGLFGYAAAVTAGKHGGGPENSP